MKDNDTNSLTFNKLATINAERCLAHYHSNLNDWSPTDWGCAVAGEAGELCNILKKIKRIDDGLGQFNKEGETIQSLFDAAGNEMADVVIYLDLLAQRLGLNLEHCIKNKFNYNSELIGSSHKL